MIGSVFFYLVSKGKILFGIFFMAPVLSQLLSYNNIDIIFISQYFLANLLQKLKDENLNKTLIIHDEIHNLPTDNMLTKIKGLHKDIEYTLGLSATVKDAYDADKDNKLFEEIGDIIFKFGTEDAIKKGILVEFDVDFIEYELTES